MTTTGLEGVVVAETRLGRVLGDTGRLIYAGYEIEDLARNASFEEVCHLLWTGELPDAEQLARVRAGFTTALTLAPGIEQIVRLGARQAHPMATLQACLAAAAFFDPDAADASPEAELRKSARLTAQAVAVTAAIGRIRAGHEPMAPDPGLGLAANLLHMLHGTPPSGQRAATLDTAFTLHAEHGMNASTFAARVATATGTDMHAAVAAAVGTLKGPLHGGANEKVMAMLLDIGEPERAEEWVLGALARGDRVMGFGHRVYRTLDPRAPILEDMARKLLDEEGDARWLHISGRIQAVMAEAMKRRDKPIYPNVDFFSASVYYTLGVAPELFTNIFACARMPGWTAHIIEQRRNNRLIRPSATYIGPGTRSTGRGSGGLNDE
jgi:citrate synthase